MLHVWGKIQEFIFLKRENCNFMFEAKSEIVTYIFEVAYARKCKLQLAHAPTPVSSGDVNRENNG